MKRDRSGMREVAALAGVALSSVSRVLSDHPDVSPEMRERVLAAVERLGYTPDLLAQSMRRQETRSVGFIVGDISNPLFAEIVKGAENELRDQGYSMLLTNSEGNPDLDAAHVRLLDQRRVDGFILSLAEEDHRPTMAELERVELPMVLIDRELEHPFRASRVLSDHRTGMRAAVSHLLELGHERVGLIVGSPVRPSTVRSAALAEIFEERALAGRYEIVPGRFSETHGSEATARLMSSPNPPSAIIVGSNQALPGALKELRRRGLRAGRDVSIVGCDAVAVAEIHDPPIAVIRRDTLKIGRVAAQLLLELMQDDGAPRDVVLPTDFRPTPSCAPPRAPGRSKRERTGTQVT